MKRTNLLLFFAAGLLVTTSSTLAADTSFFGGTDEKFKGAGDKQPPECEIDVPNGASEEFFIRWNCKDQFNNTPQEKIRSAVWIKRTSDTRWTKVDDFLGFPASLFVDKGLLKLAPEEDFTSGLPVSFKFEAMDTAGITTISESFTVLSKSAGFSSCNLEMVTAPTPASEGGSGTPSSTVSLQDAPVKLDSASDATLALSSTSATEATTCEIDSVCENDSQITFNINLNVDSAGAASGTVLVAPGNIVTSVTGTVVGSGSEVSSLSLNGTTTVDDATATVTVNCTANTTASGSSATRTDSGDDTGVIDSSAVGSEVDGSAEVSEDVVVQELEVSEESPSDESSKDAEYSGSARKAKSAATSRAKQAAH